MKAKHKQLLSSPVSTESSDDSQLDELLTRCDTFHASMWHMSHISIVMWGNDLWQTDVGATQEALCYNYQVKQLELE